MDDNDIRQAAREIADEIISAARGSGDDPIAWVTGSSYMPPLRSFAAAERVYQDEINNNGEAFALLMEQLGSYLVDAAIVLECPEWDNALYAVDTARFSYVESSSGETLQDEWQPV